MAKRLDDMLDSRENVKEKKANCHEPANDMLRINAELGRAGFAGPESNKFCRQSDTPLSRWRAGEGKAPESSVQCLGDELQDITCTKLLLPLHVTK